MCAKYGSNFNPINIKLFIGIGADMEYEPINGLRHPEHGTMNGWYIWCGEFSDSDDFFKPIHIECLLESNPEILKYLSLDVGFRFLIDKKGYEDVWFDEKLKNI
ncbi:immunity protein Imm33 domain-containing protein [Cellulophaga lytica]|uniref:immunity protein Imm33 domain-containing protein n=1 Tax=Cellulophaga lytica TaxID=979 RepID=UPI003CE5243F